MGELLDLVDENDRQMKAGKLTIGPEDIKVHDG
ncbi:hypothetical protein J2S35_001392 [Falsarthrobacter nasiphocae]|uniref:Uncharacterized protein n=1 Tax=Falsarthrobacter nasiphocae TaxID=189863 RepID=A0AAE3YHL7_9MICC|nr:hypothetical protein [Falsarthrobacter nasiphocae]